MMLTVQQVSEKLGLSVGSVQTLIRKKELPAVDIAKPGSTRHHYRVHDHELKLWRQKQNGTVHSEPTVISQQPLPADVITTPPAGYVSASTATKVVKKDQSYIRQLAKEGKIESVRIDGRTWLRLQSVVEFFETRRLAQMAKVENRQKVAVPDKTGSSLDEALGPIHERLNRMEGLLIRFAEALGVR
jgi:excisionase family DNA binding protein